MKAKILMGLTGVLMALSSAMGVTVTATSNPFNFPAVGRRQGRQVYHQGRDIFQTFGVFLEIRRRDLCLVAPRSNEAQRGSIAIYSVLGRMVKSIPIASAVGVVTWKTSQKEGVGGLYVAKLTYGSHKQNLKLILCK